MKKFKLLTIALLTVFGCKGQAQDTRLHSLETEITSLMEVYKTVGLAVAIVENDKVIYTKGFGFRNHQEKLPVTPNTLFPIGSVTKPITASLIGVYQGRGELSVNDKPRKFIKTLQFYSDEMNNLVTIEDLLAHRSGIGNVDGAHVFFPTNELEKHFERLPYLKPNSEVRERLDYSNMGYAILGGITETLSGKTWAKNIKEEIFTPLKMYDSSTTLADLQKSENYALGYSIANDAIVKVEYEDQNESVASGAINSSVNDLSKWVKLLLNQGVHENQQIIPKKYLEASFSEHNIIRGSFSFDKKYKLLFDTYGYGWFVHHYKNLYRVNHGGNVSGFTASVELYPHKNIGIILLTNQGSANLLTKAIGDIIINRLLNLEKKAWNEYEDIQVGEARVLNTHFKTTNTDKKPNQPLKFYVGKYQHQGYGIAEVLLKNDQLIIQFPAFEMGLEHHTNNTFINRVITKTHQNTPSFYINFLPNNEDDIAEMTISFSQEPIRFKRIK